MSEYHCPVLLRETMAYLFTKPDGVYVDATFGGGGHSRQLLLTGAQRVIAFDQDEEAIRQGKKLQEEFPQLGLIKSNFKNMRLELANRGITKVQGVLFDLGVSSHQLEDWKRGFSWKVDCPLDMRMDRAQTLSAETVVNSYSEEKLAEVIYKFGEERFSKQIARKIVELRKKSRFLTTGQLREAVFQSVRGKHQDKIKSVMRVFQAIRIEVNQELAIIEDSLRQAFDLLATGGRLVVISFHSLEDRIVKNFFKGLPKNEFTIITKKPIRPTVEEIKINPKARSAKLRAGEKNG